MTHLLHLVQTQIQQPLSFQQTSPRNYEPPPVPPQSSTHTTPHDSP